MCVTRLSVFEHLSEHVVWAVGYVSLEFREHIGAGNRHLGEGSLGGSGYMYMYG